MTVPSGLIQVELNGFQCCLGARLCPHHTGAGVVDLQYRGVQYLS